MDDSLDTIGMDTGTLGPDAATMMEPTVTALDDRHRSGLNSVDLSFLAPSTRAGSLGRVGEYEILGVLGRGAMGIVLRGYDRALNRVVAVKVHDPALALGRGLRARFLREARAAAAINHPGVVTIYKVNVARERPYLAMEFVAGTLRDRIRSGDPLETVEVLRVALQLAEGLAAAHAQGVLHRDIKPANILLEEGAQRVKISDFGLAISGLSAESAVSPEKVMGTPAYMSPEQVRNEPLDARSDLFSLGCVIYAMLTRRSPFSGETTSAALAAVLEYDPPPPPEAPHRCAGALNTLVMKLLRKQREDRPGTASQVAAALRLLVAEANQTPSNQSLPAVDGLEIGSEMAPQPASAWIWPMLAIASLMVAVVAGLVLPRLTPDEDETFPTRASKSPGAPRLPFFTPTEPVITPGKVDWVIGRSGPADFPDLRSALASRELGAGSTLRLLDGEEFSGSIVLNDSERHRDLTIESTLGATLTEPDGEAILAIQSVPGVTLRGLTFKTGLNRFAVLVVGPCEGLTIMDSHFDSPEDSSWTQVFLKEGASGTETRPIVITGCSFVVGHGGVTLQGDPAQPIHFVEIRGNRFEGDDEQVLVLQAADDVTIRDNLFRNGIGVIVNLNSWRASDILIANNTFYRLNKWVYPAESTGDQPGIVVCNNAILQVKEINGGERDLAAMAQGGWNFHHNVWEPGPNAMPGASSPLAVTCPNPAFASTEPGQPQFLHPTPDSFLTTAGAGGNLPTYVGAFPPMLVLKSR